MQVRCRLSFNRIFSPEALSWVMKGQNRFIHCIKTGCNWSMIFIRGRYLVEDHIEYQQEFLVKEVATFLEAAYEFLQMRFSQCQHWNKDMEPEIKQFYAGLPVKNGRTSRLRVMFSGVPMGPDIYAMMEALGQSVCLERMNRFLLNE